MFKPSLLSNKQSNNHSNIDNANILIRVRLIAIVGQLSLVIFAEWFLEINLPLRWLLTIIAIEIVFQLVALYRVGLDKKNQQHLIRERELLIHIIFDSIILAALIYFSGGPNNPFIYLMLLYIALSTLMLAPKSLLIVTALQLLFYSFLNIFQRDLELGESSPLASFHLHLLGMWVNFVLTTILVAVFGLLTRLAMLKKEKELQTFRENQMQDEQILSLGIMSASAAHELGTPLTTMAIVIDDLKHDERAAEFKEDMSILSEQISKSRFIIQSLNHRSAFIRNQLGGVSQSELKLVEQLNALIQNWLVYQPKIKLTPDWHTELKQVYKSLPISVEQAITSLLDNAAEASLAAGKSEITMLGKVEDNNFILEIRDFGNGISLEKKNTVGLTIQNTEKSDGLGWGLFLSNASIERTGGNVQIDSIATGGTLIRISLPLEMPS